jgi:hypothetical protein
MFPRNVGLFPIYIALQPNKTERFFVSVVRCSYPTQNIQLKLTVSVRGVGIAQSVLQRDGRPGFESRQCKIFLFCIGFGPIPGPTQPLIQRVLGVSSPGGKQQEREADHSPPSSAEVKKCGVVPHSHICLMA